MRPTSEKPAADGIATETRGLARRVSEAALPARSDVLLAKPWHGLAAGCIAGASGVIIGHAFDTAKVRAQVSSGGGSSSSHQPPKSLLSLYRGILPPLLTTGAVRSIYFGVYETLKPLTSTAMRRPTTELSVVFVAGALTGLVVAPVTAPVQRLKLVQQVEGGSVREVWKRLMAMGTSSLFRGLGLHTVLETIGSGCYLLAYAATKKAVASERGAAPGAGSASVAEEPLSVRVACGMVAGCCGWISIYPLDVLRSRVMSVGSEAAVAGSTAGTAGFSGLVATAVRETYASGGIIAFYRGLGFTLLRAAPVAGTVLPVYDVSKAWFAELAA
jgi:solute carrier family 25 carnitine/acylcarnitine transporter 20/29